MTKKVAWIIVRTMLSILLYIAAIVGIAALGKTGYEFMYDSFSNPVYDSDCKESVTVTVQKGEDSLSVMKELQSDDAIADYRKAYLRYQFSKYKGQIQPGTYQISPSMPMDQILGIICNDEQYAPKARGKHASSVIQ